MFQHLFCCFKISREKSKLAMSLTVFKVACSRMYATAATSAANEREVRFKVDNLSLSLWLARFE